MKSRNLKKLQTNIKKTLFGALELTVWCFVSAQVLAFGASKTSKSMYAQGVTNTLSKTFWILVCVLTIFSWLFITYIAESNLSHVKKLETVNVLPTTVSGSLWHNPQSALVRDVDSEAIYQSFTKLNSAYFDGQKPDAEIYTEEIKKEIEIDSMSDGSENDPDGLSEVFETGEEEMQPTETADEATSFEETITDTETPDENVGEPDTDDDAESAPISLREMSIDFLTVTQFVSTPMRFVLESLHEFAEESEVEISSTASTEVESLINSGVTETEEETYAPAILENNEETISESENETISSPDIVSSDTAIKNPDVSELSYIEFDGFALPKLKSGQFIRNMQLRVSLAGFAERTERIPSVRIEYTLGDVWESAGIILLDGEVSNALNGGDFLFALPLMQHIDDLEQVKVRLAYDGTHEQLESVFIDALWLEIDTEIFDRTLLDARIQPQALSHLNLPQVYELLNGTTDFTRDESPVFSLRYESQRNVAVQLVRQLLGRRLASIEEIVFTHSNTGKVALLPQVTVTDDGLFTIQLTDEDKKKLQPGTYTVEITVKEGGKEFSDSFDFQWGMLALNPDQAQYLVADPATITLGALSPNGNTICDAILQLYVIDPQEYMYEVPVIRSGHCDGNNVTPIPDYSAHFVPTTPGTYTMYVERQSDIGEVISHTNDTFVVVDQFPFSIERQGPTRIFPPAPYPMQITITAHEDVRGVLTERVPDSFLVFDTMATIEERDEHHELSWEFELQKGETHTVSYSFDAPDRSPYLYSLGPARVEFENTSDLAIESSEDEIPAPIPVIVEETANIASVYEEHRAWQIASDATGNMLLFWDTASGIPTNWSCVSCTSGDPFYQRFIVGSSTYNTTGGTTTHTHTATGTVFATASATTENFSGSSVNVVAHTHTATPTIDLPSNLPRYRQLQVIQYTGGAGEPAAIPTGAIGMFDAAIPSGWTQYSAQNGYYIRGESTIGTTGGSNTHTHTITGTTTSGGGSTVGNRGAVAEYGSPTSHTHTISTTSLSVNHEPPYITVMLAQITATGTAPNGLLTMWTDEVPAGWVDVSSNGGDAFNNKFISATSTYGSTGGALSHTLDDIDGIVSSAPIGTAQGARAGSTGASSIHTHSVNVTDFSTTNHLPPYVTVIVGKRQGENPLITQHTYRWYVNTNAQLPTDVWPSGATNLAEGEAITATSTPVEYGDIIRLRMSASVDFATATASTSLKLQYASTTSTCGAITTWNDVGASTSSAEWRGYNNTLVSDHGTISTSTLTGTTKKETYEENGYTVPLPTDIPIDDIGEWDFTLINQGAYPGATYCFRLAESDGDALYAYATYPTVLTNDNPDSPTLSKLFDNEKTASTSPWFEFVTGDAEDDELNYQVQIDNDIDFGSTVADHNTETNDDLFLNLVVDSDKDPFTPDQLMRYMTSATLSNGVTYWWRVRARDPQGSNQWGEWATPESFTIDTVLDASAWFQTTEEQFETSSLTGVEAVGSDQVQLITGSTTGTMVTDSIDFDDGALGTAWDALSWGDTETSGDIKYSIEYRNTSGGWTLIPDADLSGNSTGFDTHPVSLLGLDTDTYNELRIIANFTNSGGSPSLQDITLAWGYRVETPTLSKLFPNEKVGTTTPTFEFTTSDPQSDSLTYQISWSEDDTFTSSTTRTSDIHAGFVNAEFGGDTDPFDSGSLIQFKVQSSDALTHNATYWWRVRAKDTTGDNAYSLWTQPRSFTVHTSVVVSTWFQTMEEQFNLNILSGTRALVTDALTVATTAVEALAVYGEGVETIPRYRLWDGAEWSNEGELLDVDAPIRWLVAKAGITREEYVVASVGTDGDVNAQVYALGEWGDLLELTTTVGSVSARGVDIAYETTSGDALVVYCDGDADPSYYVWNGTSWTSGGTINLASTDTCEWIQLASDPISDEIIVMARDSVGTGAASYESQVWSGSAWSNSATQGGSKSAVYETMALEYEDSGGQALTISGDGNPARFEYNSWNGSTWAGLTTTNIPDNLIWAELVRDLGTDVMAMCYIDESAQAGVIRWTGSAWTGQSTLDATANAVTDRAISCAYETTSGRDGNIMSVYSDTTNARYSVWNGSSWTAEASVSTIEDSASIQTVRTGIGTILALFLDDVNDRLDFSSWNGSTWSTAETIENNVSVDSVPYGEPFMVTPRNAGREGAVVVSPPISFTEGVGPYWDQMDWTDSTPGTSDILYSMQYYDSASSTWKFIPDTDLPGNTAGTSTGPIDLSDLNITTYDYIRPYALLSCDGSNNCPTLSDWTVTWAEGITVSGTLHQYDRTSSTTSGTVAVAVDGVLQIGKTGSVSNGAWSIDNVTTFPGDIVTVFMSSAGDDVEAVGVTRYDGLGDISGFNLFERHLAIGSNDSTTTPITNSDIGLYTATNDEDLFHSVSSGVLNTCGDVSCGDTNIIVKAGMTYRPYASLFTHDMIINGTLSLGGHTLTLSGSWDNNATATLATSTVLFSATSTSETIDSTGSVSNTFYNVTISTTTSSATWTLVSALDIDNNLSVAYGTLSRENIPITIGGNLTNGSGGYWSGLATTTFDGTGTRTWSDQNAVLQNVGRVAVDGTSKTIQLAGNVLAMSIYIGADDILDASVSNYDVTTLQNWINNNTFVPRSGEVFFSATTTNRTITVGSSAFYDLTFNGAGGAWSFSAPTLSVQNNFTVSTGTVTLPTGTTTVAGSWNTTGGTFAHSNGTVLFTASSAKSITLDGDEFTNAFYTLTFNGGGSWTFVDSYATSTNDVRIQSGTVTLPGTVFSVGNEFMNTAGSFAHSNGTVVFTASGVARIDTNASFNSMRFTGSGDWSFVDTSVTAQGDIEVLSGELTLPSSTLTLGGSFTNTASVLHNNGAVVFNSSDTGETIALGGSSLYDATFNSLTGGWTITESATTTHAFTLATTSTFTLSSGQTLTVNGTFTNAVSNASTTWTGSTLLLNGGAYSINAKTHAGDTYGTLRIDQNTDIKMWNSSAVSYTIDSTGSLYSQDHAGVDGDLYIFGAYERTSGNEYWSYATDFDGTALGGGSRQAHVFIQSGSSPLIDGALFEIVGTQSATTTIANQGSGTYALTASSDTMTFNYYDFDNLSATGVTLSGTGTVTSLSDGALTPSTAGGTGFTIASTTIGSNPALQIYRIDFSTTTAISATNVTQNVGTPTSYWWFRESTGNIDGEMFDNDSGDPGEIRWDDSSLVLTISGKVYSDDGATAMGVPVCDDSTDVIHIVVQGGSTHPGECSSVDGTYSIGGVTVIGSPVVAIFLDTNGGAKGTVITKTPTANITNLDIYQNRVITRHEDVSPLTIADMAVFGMTYDTDMSYSAATGTEHTLTLMSDTELHVASSTTFIPGGVVTINAHASSTTFDGSLHIDDDATFVGYGTSTITIGGNLIVDTGASFVAGSTTVLMNATTTGKTITTPSTQEIGFNELVISGDGGGWNINGDIRIIEDMHVATGTLTGTADVVVEYGSLFGNGVLSFGAGTTTIERTNTLGGTVPWSFANLVLGSGVVTGTTTPSSGATTTILGTLTIGTGHYLDAGSSLWNLSGTGNVFVENGTFLEDTSTIRYSGIGATNVISTSYYNLDLKAQGSSPTYTATGLGLIVLNDLTIGGATTTTFTLDSIDPALDVNGDVTIDTTGTLSASGSGVFTMSGNWDNNGTFTANGGTVTFDTSGTTNIDAGNSPFGSVTINGSGDFTVSSHATATNAFTLTNANSFTLASGQALAIGGALTNGIGGAETTWTGSTVYLYSGTNYSINASTTSDTYETLIVGSNTDIRMWNSSASTHTISSTGSLYSQDHASTDGELYIFGNYPGNGGTDYWSYANDFDGTSLGGGSRKVDVYIANGGSVEMITGSLAVLGDSSASTTIQNQGSGTYAFRIGGNASTTWSYYEVRDADISGITFSGTPNVNTLSYGDFLVSTASGTAITVGGTVITQNQAKTFTQNIFATTTAIIARNVTATGTTASTWRFSNHTGNIDGEALDSDPAGDPGYIVWVDSAQSITVSGKVYLNEGSGVSGACDDTTPNITLVITGPTSTSTPCSSVDGSYSIGGISYSAGNSIIVYIDGETEKAATVTIDPISNISDMDLYESRVIVRHEGPAPMTIFGMTFFDSSEDPDVPFTAVDGSPDTLTLPSNRKLIIWANKTFTPGGNVTISGGGAGGAHDGTLELQSNAMFDATGAEAHTIGGSLVSQAGASVDDETSTFNFTTTGSARTVDTNENALYNATFNGSGSWTVSNTNFTVANDLLITQGTVTLPSATTTIGGSLTVTGGSFISSGGTMAFTSSASETILASSSSFSELVINGTGSFVLQGTHATATDHVRILDGSLTSATGTLAIGGDFINSDTFVHGGGILRFTSTSPSYVTANGSDLFSTTFVGNGTYTFTDTNVALLGTLRIEDGDVTLATGTMSIGGSFLNVGGNFDHASGTLLFNSSDTGEIITAGGSLFHSVMIGSASGGWTINDHATTTSHFTLSTASSFTLASSTWLEVEGTFTNAVGGAGTTWTGSTLVINSGTTYSINTRTAGGDMYNNVRVGSSTMLRAWDSGGTIVMLDGTSSLYSQDHAGTTGVLNIYGNYSRTTGTDYWSYATDFDGTSLAGSERQALVYFAENATSTLYGGTLNIEGASGFDTTITNQGSGTYALRIYGGSLNAEYYSVEDLNSAGLVLSGTSTITSLSEGNYILSVNGGALVTLSSTTLNYNAGLIITNTSFATTSAITGDNVVLVGTTPSAWTFVDHSGNFDGEAFDDDGGDDCGSIHWDDSSCLLAQQSGYRFRNDDGGEGVPDSEWFDLDWDKRTRVTVTNADAESYTDAVVELTVSYDSDMQSDFDDIRFTDDTGLNELDYFIETYTASTDARVWVEVPLLATSTETYLYMYYGNGGVSDASATSTFLMIDEYEDGNITEYSGDTGEFVISNTDAYERTYRLNASDPASGKTDLGGMYNNSYVVSQGQTLRYFQYINASQTGDESCTAFGTQSQTLNYAVCLELFGVDRMSLARNVLHRDTSGTVLASTTVTYSTGWYEVEIDWHTDDSIDVSLYQDDTLVATTSASDANYTTGGIGYTLWTYHGGWDMYTARPLLTTEPTVAFGGEQVSGGASWASALNTPTTGFDIGDRVRLRFLIENSGLVITDQNFEIEYAPKASAPSCESVDYDDFVSVPIDASCGTNDICMESSSYLTNLANTTDVLGGDGVFTSGQFVEDPSNQTGNITVENAEYTELEYVITPTENVTDTRYCFRVTNDGTELDAYTRVAELGLVFAPTITALTLNAGEDIVLLGGATTTVTATGTASDLNGYQDLTAATTTIFRSGVGESCTADNNNCYISGDSLCSFSNCSGYTCEVTCSADVYYHADPTDIGTYAGETWRALLRVTDALGNIATATAPSIDLYTLNALSVEDSINYGSLDVNTDTGAYNATTTVENIGNALIDISIEGTDLSDGGSSEIPVSEQIFATSTFTYSACTYCEALDTTPINYNVDLTKPTTTSPGVSQDVYWGIQIPYGVAGTPHQGVNTFYAVSG